MAGILAFGAYVPRKRLQRSAVVAANGWFNSGLKALGRGERAIANWDEDSITMAVEALRDCLGDLPRESVRTLLFASTSPPFADRQNAGIVKEALNLDDNILTIDIGGSQKAGTGALIQALKGTGEGQALCVASERRRARAASEAELINGDAAAAFLIGEGDVVADLIGSHSVSVDFVDHFRSTGEAFDYSWETRWIRDEGYVKIAGQALRQALEKHGVAGEAVDHLIVPIPAKGIGLSLAKAAGISAESVSDGLDAGIGNAGSAHPLLMLAHVLENATPGEIIAVLGFGQGCDVLLLRVAGGAHKPRLGVSGWAARRQPEDNYVKHLFFAGLVDLERGMRAEFDQKTGLAALYRNRKAVLGLVGSKDRDTGVVQFPPTPIGVAATEAVTGRQDPYPLAEKTGHILTFTADKLTYTPDPPAWYGTIAFEGGGRMVAEFVDAEEETVTVGRQVRMMFRIKAIDEQRSFTKYFWKAAPVGDGTEK